ncbi:class I SAM-dependent methyltransferase [Streptomyces sp. NPDC050560]|uniref:class I SAM-dependent methyltransferase n=1 Tax=Streptomyces sp. NPDC050560 TaxID=3365630 RepID=UPI003795BEED
MDSEEWVARQRRYWDSLSTAYDRMYDSAWSARENGLVAGRLAPLLPPGTACHVLELGCGTGLGYDLLARHTTAGIRYTGIDVSPGMLAAFARKHRAGEVTLVNAPVEEVPADRFADVDLVMALFTSASYVRLPLEALLRKILGWMRPKGGRLYLSFLNRTSLRLAPAWGFRPEIQYSSRRTRGAAAPALRYSRADLLRAARAHGLAARIVSLGPLTGMLEMPLAWSLNRLLADFTPGTHTIEMIA